MPSRQQAPVERLRLVTAATMRAIAERADLTLSFGTGRQVADGAQVRLAAPAATPSCAGLARLRGEADSIALRFRHHDAGLHARLAPLDEDARAVFDALERARFEAIGARRLAGVAANLDAALEARCREDGFAAASERLDVPLAAVLALLARARLTGARWPRSADTIVGVWRSWLNPRVEQHLSDLADAIEDQAAYSSRVHRMLADLELDRTGATSIEFTGGAAEPDRSRMDDAPDREATLDATSDDEANPPSIALEPRAPLAGHEPEDDLHPAASQRTPRQRSSPVARPERASADYHPFTTAHDQIVVPTDLCDASELARLRQRLDEAMSPIQAGIQRMASGLYRRLLARQARAWDFDLEEGVLDTERLARAIVDPSYSLVCKQARDTVFPDTIVTLLIDNSGSMRGPPIALAAMTADILARTLERCAVKVEILGFTTRAWKGGQSRDQWLAQGRPADPGRLTDLRHIVYKSAATPWRRARTGLGLMLHEGLLKENVDGEALLWAHDRLMARSEQRRILMVVSDGTPLDDSTLSANAPECLDRHLRQVIDSIETCSPIELSAIGIRHDVSHYYRRALTIMNAEQLGSAMIGELGRLLENPVSSRRSRRHMPR